MKRRDLKTRNLTVEEAAMERESLAGTSAGETMDPAEEGVQGGSDLNIPQKNLAEEGQEMIRTGLVYKEKNGTQEVVPFFVDFATAHVRFAPLGRATEDQMRTSDFLNRYEFVGESRLAEAAPAEKEATKK